MKIRAKRIHACARFPLTSTSMYVCSRNPPGFQSSCCSYCCSRSIVQWRRESFWRPGASIILAPSPTLKCRSLRCRPSQTQLPHLGLGRSFNRQRLWCILGTQKRYWWHLRCAFFYAHDLCFHPCPSLPQHRKNYLTRFRCPSMQRPGAHAP